MTQSQRVDVQAGQDDAPDDGRNDNPDDAPNDNQAVGPRASGTGRHDTSGTYAADLHMHSTASDGKLSPGEVVRAAASAGAGLISLTDHDTVDGLEEAHAAATAVEVDFVSGVEISAREHVEVHLLAYGFQEEHSALGGLLENQIDARRTRGERFIQVLVEAGALPESAALELAGGPESPASITRPHIADLLVEHGTVQDRREAFDRFLIESTDTFVPKPMPSGAEVIDAVHTSGGIVSLAHPGHAVPHRVVLALIDAGLDAVEVVHPSHDEMLETYYRQLAERYDLLMTGGSDFHEYHGREGRNLGRMGFYPDERLLRRLRTLPKV